MRDRARVQAARAGASSTRPPTPALSVRVGRCRYGSPSVGAGQRPAKALALLPPSVGGVPPSVARFRPLLLPLPWPGPAVAELPRAALSDPPQAAAGQPAQGVGNLGVVCPPAVRAHHADGPGRAPAPGQACHGCLMRPVPIKANASLAHPAPGRGPCHGARGQSGSQHR